MTCWRVKPSNSAIRASSSGRSFQISANFSALISSAVASWRKVAMPVAGKSVMQPVAAGVFQVEQQSRSLVFRELLQLFPKPLEKHPLLGAPGRICFARRQQIRGSIVVIGERFDWLIADALERGDRAY